MTKFHSEQKVTVTMEFDKSILTVSFFFDDVEVDCVFGPHTHFSKSGRIIPINFFIHNYIIHKKKKKFEIVSKKLFTHAVIY